MLQRVDVGFQPIGSYVLSAGRRAIERMASLAQALQGLRVLHLSATSFGGGVAEILRSEIPLLRTVGIKADWQVIAGDETFFAVTKKIHNCLQGAPRPLTVKEQETYLRFCVKNARLFEEEYDVIVVHDPQPLALPEFHRNKRAKWIWRCHIDTSQPNADVWNFLQPYLAPYDATVFTLKDFIPSALSSSRVEIIPPAIDPESPKNIELDHSRAASVLDRIGMEDDRPLITQVSRFDPWKDPLGTISAYKIVKPNFPELQLALVGSMAHDDPEGWRIHRQVLDACADDPSIHVLTNLDGIGDIEVNALQRRSDLVMQKSIREGFGLVVAETLWKGTPIVASRTGGIPLQMNNGTERLLVNSVEESAERILWVLRNPEEGKALARRGKKAVRDHFLLPRLVADELELYASVLSQGSAEGPSQPRRRIAPEA